MSTPHNSAEVGQIAKTVLMPGDPLRAKYIAETFLEGAQLFTKLRNVYGYTGTYKGKPVSVMASGMGMPSIGIYAHELYNVYGVENIIRVGTTGSLQLDLKVGDIVLVSSAFSNSSFAQVYSGDMSDVQYPNGELQEKLRKAAKDLGVKLTEGCVHSSDVFYPQVPNPGVAAHGCVAVEMESFALFHMAKVAGKRAACLLTVSDEVLTGNEMPPEDRENTFADMMRVALEA